MHCIIIVQLIEDHKLQVLYDRLELLFSEPDSPPVMGYWTDELPFDGDQQVKERALKYKSVHEELLEVTELIRSDFDEEEETCRIYSVVKGIRIAKKMYVCMGMVPPNYYWGFDWSNATFGEFQ